jgi:muramidase (phage lysozyme)
VSQDRAAVALLKQCGAYELVRLGRFDAAVSAARGIWASLPGAGYGQKEHALETLRAAYSAAGGSLS